MKDFNDKLSSKYLASQRLKLILIHDRVDLDPAFLEMIKCDIMDIIAKYVEINNSDVEVRLIKSDIEEDSSSVLVANIPISGYR